MEKLITVENTRFVKNYEIRIYFIVSISVNFHKSLIFIAYIKCFKGIPANK